MYSAIVDITTVDESWLASASSPPSEQERFLLRELVQLFQTEGLINSGKSEAVLIVPAKSAIEDYLNFSVYFCQPKRSFQPVDYIGFYHNGVIDNCIAKILRKPPVEGITLNEEGIENPTNDFPSDNRLDLLDLVARLRTHKSPRLDQYLKVFFLSSPDSSDTIKLAQDIRNTQKDRSGRPTAFTQGQRYVPLSALRKNPATTTELLKEPSA